MKRKRRDLNKRLRKSEKMVKRRRRKETRERKKSSIKRKTRLRDKNIRHGIIKRYTCRTKGNKEK
jgi:hypothetical protein